MQIFVSKNGKQLGPLTRNQVKEHLAAGTIATTDYFWCDDLGEWKILSEFEGQKHVIKPQVKRPKSSLSNWWAGLDGDDFIAYFVWALVFSPPLIFVVVMFYDHAINGKENNKSTIARNPQSEVPVDALGYPVNWGTMTESEKDKWLEWRLEQGIPQRNPFAKPLATPLERKFKLKNKHLENILNEGPRKTLDDVKSLVGVLDDNWHEDGIEDLNRMPNLEGLGLGGNSSSLTDNDVATLCEIKLDKLERLIMPRTPEITINSVKMAIKAFPSIKSISIAGCPKISREECVALEKIHPNLKIWGDWNLIIE